MSSWLAIPSCRPLPELIPRLEKWSTMGYKIALLRQNEPCPVYCDIQVPAAFYHGWARSTNMLAALILATDPLARWIVGGGDDYLPDLAHPADFIAQECTAHFAGTFGVMQPTGDRWLDTPQSRAQFGEDRGAMLDRIAGSPWMGREWCERAYGGRGPMDDSFFHCWSDEALQLVAERLGVFWQRRDLNQRHEHWLRDNADLTGRTDEPQSWAVADADYRNGRALFEELKRLGFPGSNPLEAK